MIPMESIKIEDGWDVPVYRLNTAIVGAGAAGMNCAVQLYQGLSAKGVEDAADRIAVITTGLHLGASRMSGSDKQTYYKVGTHPERPDSALDFAKTLTAPGCMHGDVALAEGASSLRAFFHLVDTGVPFPHDASGNYPGYKTDHDPQARGTSVGPKTSYYMTTCLQKKAERYGISIFDQHEIAHLLTEERDGQTRITGIVTLDKRRINEPGFGLTVFLCENIVLAAGGPGALYKASVYPPGQVGIHGLAFRAGLKAHNFIEWQYGLASTQFRWNVSGTYMQAVPRIFSTDQDGNDERDFLRDHFPSTAKMATDIFLKGYQWPFDAQRVEGFQSSLIDILVTEETRERGRRVFLDFRQDPVPADGKTPFVIADMEPEAREYLESNAATQATPIERLAHMNPLAIDIYREHDIDLHTQPLEIDVCAQHQNGGFVVDHWWESTIPHTFIIGEMAGTHGIKRPGGSALNSGQVGALRTAQRIAEVYGGELPAESSFNTNVVMQLRNTLAARMDAPSDAAEVHDALETIQVRSSRSAAHLRSADRTALALAEARLMAETPLTVAKAEELALSIQVDHMRVTQIALLEALQDYLKRGGGSRGSYMILDEKGVDTGTPYRFLPENEELQNSILEIALTDVDSLAFSSTTTMPRPLPETDEPFEIMWARHRSGEVFAD
jgi:succinate dehydrogenase/fumarate reductase flavoprotein subunit